MFGQVVVLVSTFYPKNMSFKLVLSSKIGGFEILRVEKKNNFFPQIWGEPPLTTYHEVYGHPSDFIENFVTKFINKTMSFLIF